MLKETMNDSLKAEYAADGIDVQRLYARDMKHDYYMCQYKEVIPVFLQIHRNTKYVRIFQFDDFHKLEYKKRIYILPFEDDRF